MCCWCLRIFLRFNPRAPCGARPAIRSDSSTSTCFNPRAPCGARQDALRYGSECRRVSIHAPHAGRDLEHAIEIAEEEFQSTRPMRGATAGRLPIRQRPVCFNPRAPCGARPFAGIFRTSAEKFQSTRPMRGATGFPSACFPAALFQSTRPMRGATCSLDLFRLRCQFQSTRPMRGATHGHRQAGRSQMFQSTRPMRGATFCKVDIFFFLNVSIHAPHAGRDRETPSISCPTVCFNPRAPCGARLATVLTAARLDMFQSTRPMRGAT